MERKLKVHVFFIQPPAVAKLNDVGIMNPGDEEDDIIFDDVEDEDDDEGAVGFA